LYHTFPLCSPNTALCTDTLTVRASGGRTPTAISTRPGDSDDVDDIASEITAQKRDQAQLKAHCFARDNNCCMITGAYDAKIALKTLSDIERQNSTIADTEAAHIIPFSLATFDEREVLFPLSTNIYIY
jgi:hypothetical protein